MKTLNCDFLVIGCGAAGLMAALHLCKKGRVFLVSKGMRSESNTNRAQGGVACVMNPKDNLKNHLKDTLATGSGLSDEKIAREIVAGGRDRIRELEAYGLSFDRSAEDPGSYDLGQEGGHSHRRVLHAGDITGAELVRVLQGQVSEEPNIKLIENWMAIDLVTTGWIGLGGRNRCVGAYFLNRNSSKILAVHASATVLATGGLGKVYSYTSNPDQATGDGVAMAWRTGLPIRDMEFIQFHPTCLYHPHAKSFLISEAVRGEGAELRTLDGEAFMKDFSELGSLAPRDITARAIDRIMKTRGDLCVHLDITHRSESFLKRRFPNIFQRCFELGIDMAKDPIPVVPAAHYSCGGVVAGLDGQTDLFGLLACGEVASTGLHGANRLASNSLLEALVCGYNTAQRITSHLKEYRSKAAVDIPSWEFGNAVTSDEAVVVEHNWNEVRSAMWDYVGIVRSNRLLKRARRRIRTNREEIRDYYKAYLITPDLLELRNIADVADLIVRSAQHRKESCGLHYTIDYPKPDQSRPLEHTIIRDRPGGPLDPDKPKEATK